MIFSQKFKISILCAALSITNLYAVAQSDGHGSHTPSSISKENKVLLDPSQPHGLNLEIVSSQLKKERDLGVSNSLCTQIINYASNKDKIFTAAEKLAELSGGEVVKKSTAKGKIMSKIKGKPGSDMGNQKQIEAQIIVIKHLFGIRDGFEKKITEGLGLSSEQIKKIPPYSSFPILQAASKLTKIQSSPNLGQTEPGHKWQNSEKRKGGNWQNWKNATVPSTASQ